MSTDTVFEIAAPLATLTFNRPEARNAMTWRMYEALVEACDRADRDAAVRVLNEQRLDAVLDRLERVTKPTIAAVTGVAAGGGCAIACCCDLRVATPESTFGVPIARTLGNTLSAATCSRMLHLLGPSRFKEMMFTGRLVGAADLHAAGVVNRIADASVIDRTVRDLALEIAANAPLTIRSIKEMTRRLLSKRKLTADEERELVELCYTSADFKEGVTAFLAKRKPVWTGT